MIEHLFVSPGHNFYGHHGKDPSDHPMISCREIECWAGRGIRGDRFLDYKPDYRGQITFFSMEVFEAFTAFLGEGPFEPWMMRRNVLLRGADLNSWIGKEFEIQGVSFLGTEECRPCYWMDRAFAPGAESFLKGQGGLRAKILTDGVLTVGA